MFNTNSSITQPDFTIFNKIFLPLLVLFKIKKIKITYSLTVIGSH